MTTTLALPTDRSKAAVVWDTLRIPNRSAVALFYNYFLDRKCIVFVHGDVYDIRYRHSYVM